MVNVVKILTASALTLGMTVPMVLADASSSQKAPQVNTEPGS